MLLKMNFEDCRNNLEFFGGKTSPGKEENGSVNSLYSLKNVFKMMNTRDSTDSHTLVTELQETSPGVWETNILIPVNNSVDVHNSVTKGLKSIYKNGMKNLDFKAYMTGDTGGFRNKSISIENSDHVTPQPRGVFVPVFGPYGCNFPPDYRLVQSRLGPTYHCSYPNQINYHLEQQNGMIKPVKNFPLYINNQFLRPKGLARWDSVDKDNLNNWDPFNLNHNSQQNHNFTHQNQNFTQQNVNYGNVNYGNVNRRVTPNFGRFTGKNGLEGVKREVLIYPH